MRAAERNVYNALIERRNFKACKGSGNGYQNSSYIGKYRDEVTISEDGYEVALWGHIIAERKGNRLELCDCGYETQTTTSRINAVCYAEHLPVSYRIKDKTGFFEDHDGNEYSSGHIVWDFSENRIVEE